MALLELINPIDDRSDFERTYCQLMAEKHALRLIEATEELSLLRDIECTYGSSPRLRDQIANQKRIVFALSYSPPLKPMLDMAHDSGKLDRESHNAMVQEYDSLKYKLFIDRLCE